MQIINSKDSGSAVLSGETEGQDNSGEIPEKKNLRNKDRIFLTARKTRLIIRNHADKVLNICLTTKDGKVIDTSTFLRWKRYKINPGEYNIEAWIRKSHVCLSNCSNCVKNKEVVANRDDHLFRAICLSLLIFGRKQSLIFSDEITVGDIISGIH